MVAQREPKWVVEPLAKHNRKSFCCGENSLDRYLKEIASQDARRRLAAPFVLIDGANPETVVGYYTLSSLGIDRSAFPTEVMRKLGLSTYKDIPVTLLGRLAVDKNYQSKKLGDLLLVDALKRAFDQSSKIAAVAVIVDALNERAISFYEHYEFLRFPDRPNRLFLPMGTIAQLF